MNMMVGKPLTKHIRVGDKEYMTMGITNTGFVIWLILIGYLALVGLYVTLWYLWRGIKKMFKRGEV
jgi:uncharacterized membrane protein YozB (DUF420 family)